MKSSLKFGIVILVLILTSTTYAQTFGIKAGLNLSTMLVKNENGKITDGKKILPSFQLGATAEFPIIDDFSFTTGLIFSRKGTLIEQNETMYDMDFEFYEKLNLSYLDIPLTGKFVFDYRGLMLYGQSGPCVSIGIGGKHTYRNNFNGWGVDEEEDVRWGSDANNDFIKRFDFGWFMGVGIEKGPIVVGVGYNMGLKNVSAYTGDGKVLRNRVTEITVGYKISTN